MYDLKSDIVWAQVNKTLFMPLQIQIDKADLKYPIVQKSFKQSCLGLRKKWIELKQEGSDPVSCKSVSGAGSFGSGQISANFGDCSQQSNLSQELPILQENSNECNLCSSNKGLLETCVNCEKVFAHKHCFDKLYEERKQVVIKKYASQLKLMSFDSNEERTWARECLEEKASITASKCPACTFSFFDDDYEYKKLMDFGRIFEATSPIPQRLRDTKARRKYLDNSDNVSELSQISRLTGKSNASKKSNVQFNLTPSQEQVVKKQELSRKKRLVPPPISMELLEEQCAMSDDGSYTGTPTASLDSFQTNDYKLLFDEQDAKNKQNQHEKFKKPPTGKQIRTNSVYFNQWVSYVCSAEQTAPNSIEINQLKNEVHSLRAELIQTKKELADIKNLYTQIPESTNSCSYIPFKYNFNQKLECVVEEIAGDVDSLNKSLVQAFKYIYGWNGQVSQFRDIAMQACSDVMSHQQLVSRIEAATNAAREAAEETKAFQKVFNAVRSIQFDD